MYRRVLLDNESQTDTWNTVRRALVIVSKFDVGRPSGKLKLPPKSCIPNKANIKINKNNRRRRERMDDMAFVKATTRFRKEDQYLLRNLCYQSMSIMSIRTYFVTLNTLKSLRARRAEIPKLFARGE